jgi:hypothetical protein
LWQTPVRQDHRTGTSHASASSRRLCSCAGRQRTVRPLRAKETTGPVPGAPVGACGAFAAGRQPRRASTRDHRRRSRNGSAPRRRPSLRGRSGDRRGSSTGRRGRSPPHAGCRAARSPRCPGGHARRSPVLADPPDPAGCTRRDFDRGQVP